MKIIPRFLILTMCLLILGAAAKAQQPVTQYPDDYFTMKRWEKDHPRDLQKEADERAAIRRNLTTIKNLNHGVFKVPNNRTFYLPSEMIRDYRPHSRNMAISFTFQIRPKFNLTPRVRFYKIQ